MKIIVTKKHLSYINEALGVPDSILEGADEIYDIILNGLKGFNEKKDEYNIKGKIDIYLGGKKKIKIDNYVVIIKVDPLKDYDGDVIITSMGVEQIFDFDREISFKRGHKSSEIVISVDFVVPENWEVKDLYDEFKKNEIKYISSLAHELKHKYDKQIKLIDLIGKDVDYVSTNRTENFGIPVIDQIFKRYLYYTSETENLVRATEIASKMKNKNITKSEFLNFIRNDETYDELVRIKNFTFDKFIELLYEQMNYVEKLLIFLGVDITDMSDDEKIKNVLEAIYFYITNKKIDIFNKFVRKSIDDIIDEFISLYGIEHLPEDAKKGVENVSSVRTKYFNHITKYEKRPIQYFKDEIKRFNYSAERVIRKLVKLYDMAKDDNEVLTNK